MTKKTFGAVALSAMTIMLLTGCQSVSDQIAKQMVNQATGGKVDMNANNGNLTFKDNKGNVANINGGGQRPENAPVDLPSLPGATSYGWFGGPTGGIFTFTITNGDFKTACAQMVTLVKAAGWADDPKGFNMEVDNSKVAMYKKTGYSLTLSCAGETDGKTSTFSLAKSQVPADSSSSQATTPTSN